MTKTFFSGIKQGMHVFGTNIALIVNTLLLLIVYLIGVGMTSLIARIAKKRFLDISLDKETYWKSLNLKKKPMEEYYRQF